MSEQPQSAEGSPAEKQFNPFTDIMSDEEMKAAEEQYNIKPVGETSESPFTLLSDEEIDNHGKPEVVAEEPPPEPPALELEPESKETRQGEKAVFAIDESDTPGVNPNDSFVPPQRPTPGQEDRADRSEYQMHKSLN